MSRRSYAVERAALRVPLQDLRRHLRDPSLDGWIPPACVVPIRSRQRSSVALRVRQRRSVEQRIQLACAGHAHRRRRLWFGLRLPSLTSPVR